jgi:hypothetical protein
MATDDLRPDVPLAEILRAAPASASQHREGGNEEFRAGQFINAAVAYTKAVAVADQAMAPLETQPATRDAVAVPELGALVKEKVTCLINCATCATREGRPAAALDDTWSAIDLCFTPGGPGSPPWTRTLRTTPGWGDWSRGAYLKAVLRRAEAADAAGVPMVAAPHADWACRVVPTARLGATSEAVLQSLRAVKERLHSMPTLCPAASAESECVLRATWSKLRILAAPAPSPRRSAATAVVGDLLFLFGGENAQAGTGCELGDAWRLPVASLAGSAAHGAQQLAWERLPEPARHGGPRGGRVPCGAACESLSLFVVLDCGVLWTLDARSDGRAWTRLRCPWASERAAAAAHYRDASLVVRADAALVYHAPERDSSASACARETSPPCDGTTARIYSTSHGRSCGLRRAAATAGARRVRPRCA